MMSTQTCEFMMPEERISFAAFLSHKYKAPEINEFFFRLFSSVADVQFEVDIGSAPTNVTRLERLIRDANAFIGIYPCDPADGTQPATEDLLEQSRYFRLELDLASRARKPGLVFCDARYRGVVCTPPPIIEIPFNIQEIVSRGAKPSSALFVKAFRAFVQLVAAVQAHDLLEEPRDARSDLVGILVPPESVGGGYGPEQVDVIRNMIKGRRYQPIELTWPPVIDPSWMGQVRPLNWILIDTGPATAATGVLGYLHGEFKPAMRLRRVESPEQVSAAQPTGLALYDGYEVGYKKDIIRWCDSKTLEDGMAQRLGSLDAGRRRISTLEEALTYFQSAALRKESVFISYAGENEEAVRDLRAAFRKKFQKVFDYRDGSSIRPGQPWLKEIFDQLALSPLGVLLLSSEYVKSGNCMHELREMIARHDGNKMQIFPVKIEADEKFEIPELQTIQYARLWEYQSSDELVNWIASNITPEEA
jgi:hypothetical protein